MKIKIYFLAITFLIFTNLKAAELDLNKRYLPLKDFLVLKYDIFIQNNIINVFKGGGVQGIAYQNIKHQIKMKNQDEIYIRLDAVMDKKRYSTKKKYYPRLKDCNQVRNKLFTNKYGYSLFSQKFNNLVNDDVLSGVISEKILNISSLNDESKEKIIKKTNIKINIIHPKTSRNISCSGNLVATELVLSN